MPKFQRIRASSFLLPYF